MSQWWDALEEEWAATSTEDGYDDHLPVDAIGSWDDLAKRDLLRIVIDGVNVDGSDATEDEWAYGLRLLRERHPALAADVRVAYSGVDENGENVSAELRMAAYERIETARLQREELTKDPTTGELVFRTGDDSAARDDRGRIIVGTPRSDSKMPSVRLATAILEKSCARSGQKLSDLVAPFPRGRLTDKERARRCRLALVVLDARRQGATLEAIGGAIDRPKQRVHELVELGEVLERKLDELNRTSARM